MTFIQLIAFLVAVFLSIVQSPITLMVMIAIFAPVILKLFR
jgi:hypothetical protein